MFKLKNIYLFPRVPNQKLSLWSDWSSLWTFRNVLPDGTQKNSRHFKLYSHQVNKLWVEYIGQEYSRHALSKNRIQIPEREFSWHQQIVKCISVIRAYIYLASISNVLFPSAWYSQKSEFSKRNSRLAKCNTRSMTLYINFWIQTFVENELIDWSSFALCHTMTNWICESGWHRRCFDFQMSLIK